MKINRTVTADTRANTAPTFNLIEDIAVLKSGKRPVKLVYGSWGDREPKFEIRSFYEDESGEMVPAKGIGLDQSALVALYDAIGAMLADGKE